MEPPPPINTATFPFTFLVAPSTVYLFSSSWLIILKSNPVSTLNSVRNFSFICSSKALKMLVPHTNMSLYCFCSSFTKLISFFTSFPSNCFNLLKFLLNSIVTSLIRFISESFTSSNFVTVEPTSIISFFILFPPHFVLFYHFCFYLYTFVAKYFLAHIML